MFDGWSRQELLQLAGIVAASVASAIGLVLTKMVKTVHVLINSRMGQMLRGAQAEGQVKERAEADARSKEDKA